MMMPTISNRWMRKPAVLNTSHATAHRMTSRIPS